MNDSNARLVGVLSYITIFGWIVAIILHNNNRSGFGAFHLRQSLGLFLTGIALSWIPLINFVAGIIVLIFLLVGLIYAVQDQETTVPFVGGFYQRIFSGIL